MNARSRPYALCSSCGAYSYDKDAINTLCNAPDKRGACDGFWQNRTRLSDWVSCRDCTGTGYIDGKRCSACFYSGWLPRR